MKNKILNTLIIGMMSTTILVSCQETFEPSTALNENSALTSAGDVETATIGTYALFKDAGYVRAIHFLTEFPSDNVAQGQPSSDDLSNCYKYTHLITSSHASTFWAQSYVAISAANKIIKSISDESTVDLLQLKGENLYIRAMMHFNLVRVFGRTYVEKQGTSLGVPIIHEGLTEQETAIVKRSTVAEVYKIVIDDLLKAADLMTVKKKNSFASKEVAYALLSRVYLYQGENEKAAEYADKVISSGRYSLLSNTEFKQYFRKEPSSNNETIFTIRHMKTDNRGMGAIGSMYYSGDINGNAGAKQVSGYGEIYASTKYVDHLMKNPADARLSFISTYKIGGVVQENPSLSPRVPMHYMTKYNFQDEQINLGSPVYLRLAEVYLNRAEAYAKIPGKETDALNDLNIIRKRAGIPELTLAGIAASGKTLLEVVLDERWSELAFEGHRIYDLFRNGAPMVRNYPGLHSTVTGGVNQTINPGDNRAVFFIPQKEISTNTNLEQNPI